MLEGHIEITMDGRKTIVKAGDPTFVVKRKVVHSVKGFKDEKVVFREQPDPAGEYKAL